LVRIDTSLALGTVLDQWPLQENGIFQSAFAVVEGASLVGAGPLLVDFEINGNPVTGGQISLTAGGTGSIINGATATADNTFEVGDTLSVVTSGTPLGSGVVNIVAQMQRVLNPGEYRLTQVNENRITIDHPAATAGFVVLVG